MLGAFSLLLWFAVLDDVEDILEHLDTVQVSERKKAIKMTCLDNINIMLFVVY